MDNAREEEWQLAEKYAGNAGLLFSPVSRTAKGLAARIEGLLMDDESLGPVIEAVIASWEQRASRTPTPTPAVPKLKKLD